jgi:hypothetical protein
VTRDPPDVASDCLKNKVCLEVTKHAKQKFDDGVESCSTTGVPKMFPTVAANLG